MASICFLYNEKKIVQPPVDLTTLTDNHLSTTSIPPLDGKSIKVRYGDLKIRFKTKSVPVLKDCLRPIVRNVGAGYSCMVGVAAHDPPLIFNSLKDA
ncbi:unnamed protein product [Clavelina lepadiformis]|uniref:Uncharacterized protein n=1 Tax=Clavelina lepadiformis TaxID=159417 RepID=A0ABP0GSB2_CLALP